MTHPAFFTSSLSHFPHSFYCPYQVGDLSASLMDQTLPTATLLLHMRGMAAFAGSGGLLGLGHHISASSGSSGSSNTTNNDESNGERSGAGVAALAIARMFACVDRVKHQSSSGAAAGDDSTGGGAVRH